MKRDPAMVATFLLEKPNYWTMNTLIRISRWLFMIVHVQRKRTDKETDTIIIRNTHCTILRRLKTSHSTFTEECLTILCQLASDENIRKQEKHHSHNIPTTGRLTHALYWLGVGLGCHSEQPGSFHFICMVKGSDVTHCRPEHTESNFDMHQTYFPLKSIVCKCMFCFDVCQTFHQIAFLPKGISPLLKSKNTWVLCQTCSYAGSFIYKETDGAGCAAHTAITP